MFGIETIKKMNQLAATKKSTSVRKAWNKQNRPEQHYYLPMDGSIPEIEPAIPAGWFRLHQRTEVLKGDRYWSLSANCWRRAYCIGKPVIGCYIRKMNLA